MTTGDEQAAYHSQYARLALKYGLVPTGVHYLGLLQARSAAAEPSLGASAQATNDRLALAALHVQEGAFRQARGLISELIVGDWKHIGANLLLGLMHDKLGESGLSRKHFAIAKVKRMRDLAIMPPKSSIPKNFRTVAPEFKVEIVDFRTVNTKDQQLSPELSDAMYLEFIDFLLKNEVYNLADMAIGYV